MSKSEVSSAFDVLTVLKGNPHSQIRTVVLDKFFDHWFKWVSNIRVVSMLLGSKGVIWQLREYHRFLERILSGDEWSRLCKIEKDVLYFVSLVAKSMKAEVDGVKMSPNIFIIQSVEQAREFCVFASLFYKYREIPRFRNILKHLLSTQEKDATYETTFLSMIKGLSKGAVPVIASSVMYFQPPRFKEVKQFIDSLNQPSLENFTVIKVETPPAPESGKENELGC